MYYQKFSASQALRPYINCYYIWQAFEDRCHFEIESPPSAHTAMIFNLSGRNEIQSQHITTKHDTYRTFISGQFIKSYSLRFEGVIDQVGIVFKPTGLFQLFGIQAHELTNQRVSTDDLISVSMKNLADTLQSIASWQKRIAALETFLLPFTEGRSSLDGVDQAANTIIASNGVVNVKDLIDQAHMSRRSFERHFFQRVGLSPKYFARMRRFGVLCSRIAGKREAEWGRLLHTLEYFDQSHLIKDFKEFSGKSPTIYLQSNCELAHQLDLHED